jgi:hypothetical protein
MRAQIIPIDAISRTDARSACNDLGEAGFEKACKVLDRLFDCTAEEKKTAIENWYAPGLLTARERDALYLLFGWERPV